MKSSKDQSSSPADPAVIDDALDPLPTIAASWRVEGKRRADALAKGLIGGCFPHFSQH